MVASSENHISFSVTVHFAILFMWTFIPRVNPDCIRFKDRSTISAREGAWHPCTYCVRCRNSNGCAPIKVHTFLLARIDGHVTTTRARWCFEICCAVSGISAARPSSTMKYNAKRHRTHKDDSALHVTQALPTSNPPVTILSGSCNPLRCITPWPRGFAEQLIELERNLTLAVSIISDS